MAQVFPKGMNVVARVALLGLPLLLSGGGIAGAAFFRSDYTTGTREVVEQMVRRGLIADAESAIKKMQATNYHPTVRLANAWDGTT